MPAEVVESLFQAYVKQWLAGDLGETRMLAVEMATESLRAVVYAHISLTRFSDAQQLLVVSRTCLGSITGKDGNGNGFFLLASHARLQNR